MNRLPTNRPTFTVVGDVNLLERIDDFRFENRYRSRSAAVIDLLKIALDKVDSEKEKGEN